MPASRWAVKRSANLILRFTHLTSSPALNPARRSDVAPRPSGPGRWPSAIPSTAPRSDGSAPQRHSRTVWSALAVTTVFPSGANRAYQTPASCPRNTDSAFPLATSHSRAVASDPFMSPLAVTTVFPSKGNWALANWPSYPRKTCNSFPLATSHSRAVPSKLAVTTVFPSRGKLCTQDLILIPMQHLQPFRIANKSIVIPNYILS